MSKFHITTTGVQPIDQVNVTTQSIQFSKPNRTIGSKSMRDQTKSYFRRRKKQNVKTSTVFDKWEEMNYQYNVSDIEVLDRFKNELWVSTSTSLPELINEVMTLEPYIQLAETKQEKSDWVTIRRLISTMNYSKGVGRNLKFYVREKGGNKILGLFELSSDFKNVGVRDRHIGWTLKDQNKRLIHTMVGSTIVSVQPFGYNFLGGKLISSLVLSQDVRDIYFKKYGDKIVGITTTSLYGNEGKKTQYDDIKGWTRLGETEGKTFIRPKPKLYSYWVKVLKRHDREYFEEITRKSRPKQQVISWIIKTVGINPLDVHHGYRRGTYFSSFYYNTKRFLRGETTDLGIELFSSSSQDMIKKWKKRSIQRIKSLHRQGKIKSDPTFYSWVIGSKWSVVKSTVKI